MKPTKNRVFCHDYGHTKMLFTEKSKADNFIKFNADEIEEENGKKPVRSYYCEVCAGWHVTSKAKAFDSSYHHMRTQMEMDRERREQTAKRKEFIRMACKGLNKAMTKVEGGKPSKGMATAFSWIKNLEDKEISNEYPYELARKIIAKAACVLAMELTDVLAENNLTKAKTLLMQTKEGLRYICQFEDMSEYVETLTKVVENAKGKINHFSRCEEYQKRLNQLKKEVDFMEEHMRWCTYYDLNTSIPKLAKQLARIDTDCVSNDVLRDVVNKLYDIREQIKVNLKVA